MMRWFGPPGRAPFRHDDLEQVPAPVGASCTWCAEPIAADEFGFVMDGLRSVAGRLSPVALPYHHECEMRFAIGSVAHLNQTCCCVKPGSTMGDPPGLSLREAARQARELFLSMHRRG